MENVGIISREAANSWKTDVDDLNKRTEMALKRIYEVLDNVGNVMKGSIADELVSLGRKAAEATHQLMQAMAKILEVVDNLLGAVAKAVQQGMEVLGNIAKTIL